MGVKSRQSPTSIFSIIFILIHKYFCIPMIVKQFQALIGKSTERLQITFPLVNEKFKFGGLKSDSNNNNNNNNKKDNHVELIIYHPISFCWRMFLDRKMGLAEAYVEGDWDSNQSPKALLTLLIRAREANSSPKKSTQKSSTLFTPLISSLVESVRKLAAAFNYLQHKWRTNTLIQSQKNIRDHYDLGNDMFELFLDKSMTYSSAIFEEPLPKNVTKSDMKLLYNAQMRKYDALFERLKLKKTDHVLEIGCGWGACAIRAVEKYGCKWTSLTISEQQFSLCKKRFKAAGLEDKIDIKFLDYRKETGIYDKVISIEMIEAVGHEYLPVYFSCIQDRLKPGGIAAIQAILCPDSQYERYCQSSDYIKKHIFPGGHMPSLGAIKASLPRALSMDRNLLRIGKHYSVTLDLWNSAWIESRSKILALGYSPRFFRKWEFYFVLCSALFEYGNIDVAQISFTKEL